jgi:hypothetical protein
MTVRTRLAAAGDPSERGQILVLFVVGLVAILGIVGLVLDSGSAYAQRREQQNVADLAAIAGAMAYLNTSGDALTKQTAATGAANAVGFVNGYASGVNGVDLQITVAGDANIGNVHVGVSRDHRNAFAGLFAMPTWLVSVEANALSIKRANAAKGVLPILFNEEAFPTALCDESSSGCVAEVYQEPGAGNEDVPQDATQFNWTLFCTAGSDESSCNADSDGVADIVEGGGVSTVITINDEIAPLNAGSHTRLFNDLEMEALGQVWPVPIVNDAGDMVGFAYFRLISVEGTSEKVIRGYFVSPTMGLELEYVAGGGEATLDTGSYSVELTD